MIELKNLSKSFSSPVVADLSYSFESGIYCIYGESGAGKTTLFNLILGLLPPDKGIVKLLGTVGVVFQEDRLVEAFSAAKNIALVTSATKQQILDGLASLGLGDVASRPVSTLSGGERRRVCLLRALINNPDILLLDEGFKGLDEQSLSLCYSYLQQKSPKLCLSITHNQQEAPALSATKLTLADGKLQA